MVRSGALLGGLVFTAAGFFVSALDWNAGHNPALLVGPLLLLVGLLLAVEALARGLPTLTGRSWGQKRRCTRFSGGSGAGSSVTGPATTAAMIASTASGHDDGSRTSRTRCDGCPSTVTPRGSRCVAASHRSHADAHSPSAPLPWTKS